MVFKNIHSTKNLEKKLNPLSLSMYGWDKSNFGPSNNGCGNQKVLIVEAIRPSATDRV